MFAAPHALSLGPVDTAVTEVAAELQRVMVPEKRDAEARVGADEDVLHLVQVNRVELLPACPSEVVVVQGGTGLLGASHSNVFNLLDTVHGVEERLGGRSLLGQAGSAGTTRGCQCDHAW